MELTNTVPEGAESSTECLEYVHKLAQGLADHGFMPVEIMAIKTPFSLGEDCYVAAVHYMDKWGEYAVQGYRDVVDKDQPPNLGDWHDALEQALHQCRLRRRRDLYHTKKYGIVFEEVNETVH